MQVYQEQGPCSQFIHHYCLAHPHELGFWQQKTLRKYEPTAKHWGLSSLVTFFFHYTMHQLVFVQRVFTPHKELSQKQRQATQIIS